MSDQVTRIFDLLTGYRDRNPEVGVALAGKVDGKWITWSPEQYQQQADLLSRGLCSLGIKKGDNVATIIRNCPEWNFFDMAIQQIGAVQVPIYPTISESNYANIFKEAEPGVIVVSDQETWERIRRVVEQLEKKPAVYSIDPVEGLSHWTELRDLGEKFEDCNLEELRRQVSGDDVASIIYTSGTTGNPKGVMLTHSNFIHNFKAASDILSRNPVKTALSFLPLCHVYERMINYMYQYDGITVYYAESIDKLRDNLKEVQPEFFCAVPRVIEKTYDKLVRTGRGLSWVKKQLFFWALHLAHRFDFYKLRNPFYRLQHKIADKLVYKKWREAFGGRLEVIVSGGATLNHRLARTFWAAGIKIMEGYGLTETSPVIAVSNFEPGGVMFGTVGPVMPGIELSFAPDGEILTKGPCLMKGYYKHPELTAEVIDQDGWFHTGDIGELIDGKYLKITDRKKEIFKTSGGKYIAPQVIENKFKESPFIENIIVLGENRQFTSALIVPNFEHLESWCAVKNHPYTSPEDAVRDKRIIDRIAREVELANESLDHIEKVKKFRLLSQSWSVETGELSPTLKLRRKVIKEKYAELIGEIYSD
ncbi:MAG: long-chain fatty acid--CoA ligase [Bacteroidales bacterium]